MTNYVEQHGGTHYKSQYEHWDWVKNNNIDYFVGNATKYIIRWKKKDGVKDLLKARSYIEKINQHGDYKPAVAVTIEDNQRTYHMIVCNTVGPMEEDVIWALIDCNSGLALQRLEKLIDEVSYCETK